MGVLQMWIGLQQGLQLNKSTNYKIKQYCV